ncbi:anti-sigma-E factor ChrR [Azorhizobium oxalatiphilum]|uniref:Anti-sigma-E factor ChrR n=1 Tax=Azorhizobium oxalatiphilum TaxID=980631 RepID=A0A917BKD7_9HYPH|nr:ChrR family anti-sigma-E factor [Azorhizobium oxalatiphilum]GGF47259.1 anti-sigma-E factor ChrR [Azorhizobium oxalatiphilum]
MTHHLPHDDTLARYAAGTLEPGLRLLVDAQLEVAAKARRRLAFFNDAAGVILTGMPPSEMAADSLTRAFASLDLPLPEPAPAPQVRHAARMPEGIRLPKALAGCSTSRWIWISPGVYWSTVTIPGAPKATVGLIKAAPGRPLPEHGHGGSELTFVLQGSFFDETGRYGPGDLCETDETVEHTPIADQEEGCICIIAMDTIPRFRGLLGALLRPFTN